MPVRRPLRVSFAILLMCGIAKVLPPINPTARADEPQQTGVAHSAIVALGQMSKTLEAMQFSFNARTFRAYAGPNGEMLHIEHMAKIVFHRPDKLSVSVTGDNGAAKMLYDGKNLVIYALKQKKYTSIPVVGSLDKALDAAEETTHMDFALADLLSNDPGHALLGGVTSGGQVGTATIDGVLCRHFFFVQAADDLDWELWLEDNDRSLPRRVVVTYRSLPGRPIFIADLSNWDFSIQSPDAEFEFNPPADAEKVSVAWPAKASPSMPSK